MGVCGSTSKVSDKFGRIMIKEHVFIGDSEGCIYSWCLDSDKPPKLLVSKAHEGFIKC